MTLHFKKEIETLRRDKIIKRFPNETKEWADRIWYNAAIKYTKGRSASGIEKNIIDYIRLKGFQAEIIKVVGREITSKDIQTSIGVLKGKRKWIPTTGTKGSSDVSATVYGLSVKIEVKLRHDRQSDAQKKYEAAITKAGGIYFIAKSEDDFLVKWNEMMKHPRIKLLSTM